MKKSFFEQVILYDYRYLISYGLLAAVGLYSLFWRLGSLLPGLSHYEADYLTTFDQSFKAIANNPLNWPHKMLVQLSSELLGGSELALRIPSALLGLVGLILFFMIIRHRFQGRVALVGVLLLTSSSWWLSTARLARPEILLPVLMLLIVQLARKVLETRKPIWLIMLAVVVGISFYVPLMPYLIVVSSLICYSIIRKFLTDINKIWVAISLTILISFIIALIISAINDPGVGRELFGIPTEWPSFTQYLRNLKESVAAIFWSAREFAPLNLGTLPFLDIFSVVMFVLGFYYLDHEVSRSLTQFLIFGILAVLLVLGIDTELGNLILLAPFVYTLVASGIVMLFSQWYEIFPRNPIARMAVFLPTIILLGTVVWYHNTRYFIAWPNSKDTINTFPPLSSAIRNFVSSAGANPVILTTDSEMPIAVAATRSAPTTQITTVASAAIGQPNLAISATAFEQLDQDNLIQARKLVLKPLDSPFASSPVVLWYTTTK